MPAKVVRVWGVLQVLKPLARQYQTKKPWYDCETNALYAEVTRCVSMESFLYGYVLHVRDSAWKLMPSQCSPLQARLHPPSVVEWAIFPPSCCTSSSRRCRLICPAVLERNQGFDYRAKYVALLWSMISLA